jgi:hypothetical protein
MVSHACTSQVVALGGRKLIYHVQTRRYLERYSGHRITQSSQPLSNLEFQKLTTLLGIQAAQAARQQGPCVQASLLALMRHWHPNHATADAGTTFQAPAAAAEVLYHLGSSTTSDTALLQGQRAVDALRHLMEADMLHKLDSTVVMEQHEEEEEEEGGEGEEAAAEAEEEGGEEAEQQQQQQQQQQQGRAPEAAAFQQRQPTAPPQPPPQQGGATQAAAYQQRQQQQQDAAHQAAPQQPQPPPQAHQQQTESPEAAAYQQRQQQQQQQQQPAPSSQHERVLAMDANSLYRMLVAMRAVLQAEASLLGHVIDILKCLLQLWDKHLMSSSHEQSTSVPISQLAENDPAHAIIALQEQLAWYLNWPLLYTRPRYAGLEEENGRSTDSSVYTKCDSSLNKAAAPSQRTFNPGIFKVTCLHGVVYGFHFMREHESPSDLFTLLLTRWPRGRLPALVWYDNMCKAYEYIIKREPWMLKFIRAFVDSFHYGSKLRLALHKCPQCFNPHTHSIAVLFNSQYEEHGNAFLSLFKRSTRTMGLKRALEMIAMVLRRWNGSKAKSGSALIHWLEQAEDCCKQLGWL